jgi:hypothetical protein
MITKGPLKTLKDREPIEMAVEMTDTACALARLLAYNGHATRA